MSPLRKPLSITNCCNPQLVGDEFFAHFHDEKGFRSGLMDEPADSTNMEKKGQMRFNLSFFYGIEKKLISLPLEMMKRLCSKKIFSSIC